MKGLAKELGVWGAGLKWLKVFGANPRRSGCVT